MFVTAAAFVVAVDTSIAAYTPRPFVAPSASLLGIATGVIDWAVVVVTTNPELCHNRSHSTSTPFTEDATDNLARCVFPDAAGTGICPAYDVSAAPFNPGDGAAAAGGDPDAYMREW